MAALSSFLLITASLFQPATALWRLPCISPIVAERADPIISPDIPSSHVHTIMSSSASARLAPCSFCTVRGGFSTACIPRFSCCCPNGTFPAVLQPAGVSIYCLQRSRHGLVPDEPVLGFPVALKMLVADPDKRNVIASNDSPGRAISWVCLDCVGPAKQEMGDFPSTSCLDGLRARVFVSSCWNGVTLDLGDHSAHMRRPLAGDADGGCPGSHRVRVVDLSYEVVFGVGGMWYEEMQPFGCAQGDPTGVGLRGDFLIGWDVDLLQRAVETCASEVGKVEDCAHFEMTSDALAGECVVVSQVEERVLGVLGVLPGCNVVQGGLGCGTGAGNRSSLSETNTVGGSSEMVSSGVADESSSGSMVTLSSDSGSPTVLSSSPNHAGIHSSPTNSTHNEKPSAYFFTATSDHSLSAAPGTTTSLTIFVTKIHSVTIITSSTSISSVVIGPSPSSASMRSQHAQARRHAGFQGQQLYGDDLRLRKH